MTCDRANDLLELYQDDLLDPSERPAMEHHLVECGGCRTAFERAREIEEILEESADRDRVSPGEAAAGLRRVQRRLVPRSPWRERLPMAAAAAAMLGMLGWFLAARQADVIRSARSGPWSEKTTWEGGAVPGAGARVQIRAGHSVTYDVVSDQAIRVIHVAGTLDFARDRDTRLDVGLIKVQGGEDVSEDGFNCDAKVNPAEADQKPTLRVGLAGEPVDAKHTALIRLVYFDGMNRETCPAIVTCGGRVEYHGAPMSRTWLKLGETAKAGASEVVLSEPVTGWKAGDKVIVTATRRDENEQGTRRPGDPKRRKVYTEERLVQSVEGTRVVLDAPLEFEHLGSGDYRGEVANLSRNVVVESADPSKGRGHTMWHRHSAGGVSYAEFRHLGKENVLGKYSLHFHLIGNSMRGAEVLGASIWDSGNRWITIHGTNYLVVRDCVGYQSVGHGFFLEDGTEVYNVLDRNLACQAYLGKRLPKQVLPFDANDGAGFWWSNNLNTFTRNVSCENDRYGFRAEATPSSQFDLRLPILQPDGERRTVDIRTLPFVRFEGNESHSEGLYGFRLGECVRGSQRLGPDEQHPQIIRDTKIWDIHYAFRPEVPSVLVEDMKLWRSVYGVYHPDFDRHVYRRIYIGESTAEPFNRGHDDNNTQFGPFSVDGLTLERSHGVLIQVSQYCPAGGRTESHFRNVVFKDNKTSRDAFVDTTPNGQPKNPPPDDQIPYYFHDWFGPGRTAKILTVSMVGRFAEGADFQPGPSPVFGKNLRVVEVKDVPFPEYVSPVDDLPPQTVITSVSLAGGKLRVRGTTADNGEVKRVLVNGREARARAANFLEWEAEIEPSAKVTAYAEDSAGNVEKLAHEVPGPRP
ncbi:MAG TPA: G8 domain-containing protein [Planctomycetota bacterium]|nr:G8 domain-containing protein [Planctomycetota bacterium]